MRLTKKCIECGKDFQTYPSQDYVKRCSRECYAKSKLGGIPWNKGKKGTYKTGYGYWTGKKLTKEHSEKISKTHIERKVNHKGELSGYHAIHKWVQKEKGRPSKCEHCGIVDGKFEWANIDHKYKKNLDDYIRLCKPCHGKYDTDNNLRDGASKRNRIRDPKLMSK